MNDAYALFRELMDRIGRDGVLVVHHASGGPVAAKVEPSSAESCEGRKGL